MAASEISGKAVVTVFVLRRSRSEVLDHCSEKPEKTPSKTSVEVHFLILGNKKQSPFFRVIIC